MTEPMNLSQVLELLQKWAFRQNPAINSSNAQINLIDKQNDHNYAIWALKISMANDGRGRLKHITAPPPRKDDPTYEQWRQSDSIVLTWILENIEPYIVNQYIDYPT